MARKHGPCVDCGVEVDRVYRPDRKRRCIDCAIKASADANRAQSEQYRARKGPYYEAWRAGMERHLARHNDTDVA